MGQLRITIEGMGWSPQTERIARDAVAALRADYASITLATAQHNDDRPIDLLEVPPPQVAPGDPQDSIQAP